MSRIVVAGSFDSKAVPLGLLIEKLRAAGEAPIVIDTSVYAGDHGCEFSADDVAARAGANAADVASLGRAEAVGTMARGAAAILADLAARGEAGGLVCMGGSNAGTVFSRLAPVLPMGIPKILLATIAAGDTRPYIGVCDAVLLYPVVDVDGDNAILRRMIDRAARTAIALKTDQTLASERHGGKAVALSMYGVTTPCVQRISDALGAAGIERYVFHANGTGGRTVELFARDRLVDGVAEVTISELADELFGGALPAGPDRLTNAARAGVPQVIAPGAIDMINFGPRETVPARFSDRQLLAHNDLVTLVRTTPEECFDIGRLTAERLGEPKAPAAVAIPLGGVSMLDRPGQPFWDPKAVRAFEEGLCADLDPSVEVIRRKENINDPAFADLLFGKLHEFVTAA